MIGGSGRPSAQSENRPTRCGRAIGWLQPAIQDGFLANTSKLFYWQALTASSGVLCPSVEIALDWVNHSANLYLRY